ncbi:Mitogen-activated protein kinase kinase 1 interacting [Nesidiocoris tenuis]|uniref:Mitogen-activated protein kinase kinase 1 interacting n=1 Tax=Nesidiocoris tenuis TaxID=355587 RepID=A0ABN7AEW2_9HEMI|nr:Mitogen-activated protein kinase kinase 1 interacting [Nesidiocoris tenuis]
MRKFLQDIVQKVIGLECIVIADRDGVPLVAVSDDKIPETALMSGLNSTFGLASLQAAKIGLGEALTTICVYSSYQVVQMDLEGLSVTFVGATDCNTGHILAVSKEVSQALVELKSKTEIDVAQP